MCLLIHLRRMFAIYIHCSCSKKMIYYYNLEFEIVSTNSKQVYAFSQNEMKRMCHYNIPSTIMKHHYHYNVAILF